MIKNPGPFIAAGARLPSGLLMVGPPGTGKTLMARVMASEAGCPVGVREVRRTYGIGGWWGGVLQASGRGRTTRERGSCTLPAPMLDVFLLEGMRTEITL